MIETDDSTSGLWRSLSLAAARNKLTLFQLLRRLLKLRVRDGYDVREALRSGVVDPRIPPEILAGCISKRHMIRLQWKWNPMDLWRHTEDKAVFYRMCMEKGLAVPPLLGAIDEKDGWAPGGKRLKTEQEWDGLLRTIKEEFVVKPSFGAYGLGVRIFLPTEGRFRDPDGKLWTAEEILKDLRSNKKYYRFVVQPRVRCHPVLEKLSGSSYLQTVRLITYVDPQGTSQVYGGFVKIIIGKNVVDNLMWGKTGNIACSLDTEKGILLTGVGTRRDRMGVFDIEKHPTTGAVFEGTQLPWWNEALALVNVAALAFLPHRTIGWDVALTPDGPVIIEGNIWWDPMNIHITTQPAPKGELNMAKLLRRLRAETPR